MPEASSYWSRTTLTRRAALRRALAAGGGLAALGLAGCASGKRTQSNSPPAARPQTAVDPTKGKPGGKLVMQGFGYPGSFTLVKSNNAGAQYMASFTHSGLLEMRSGRPGVDGTDMSVEPDLAQSMPEQPDDSTYVFKLRPAKFQNGRPLTSDDVKYSYERYAFWDQSAYKSSWTWLDRVETPDPQTVMVKTKGPYADALGSMSGKDSGLILAKEYEDTPEAASRPMGSGAFLFADSQAPVVTHYRKNPDYFAKPYPYFDELEILGSTDPSKKVSDFISRNVHVSYWFDENDRDQIKKARPDARLWSYPYGGYALIVRTDQPPLNDKRVRQALSMAIDRKAIRDATTKGEGEPDQMFTWTVKYWGFRKPSELGAAAKYWNYDPQAAKQLLSAAGVTLPLEFPLGHWDATVIGQGIVDTATLIATQWRSLGIANVQDQTRTWAQFTATAAVGNFDGAWVGPGMGGGGVTSPSPGIAMKSLFWSPPEGVKTPTTNNGHINDRELSALLEKQLTQLNLDERKQTFRQMESIAAEEQYRIVLSTFGNYWFADPFVQDIQIPILHVNTAVGYVKYWWFDRV